MANDKYRVAVLDDQAKWIEALSLLLEKSDRLEVVGAALNQQEAVDIAEKMRPNLFLVDIDLKHKKETGISATIAIRQVSPKTDVIILTSKEDAKDVIEAAAVGAIDFLPKSDGELLLPAILRYARGGFSPSRILSNHYSDLRREYMLQSLTEQENEIFQLLLEDVKISQLAKNLNKSEHTIKTQIRSLIHKMGVTRTAEAVSKFRNGGVYFPPDPTTIKNSKNRNTDQDNDDKGKTLDL